jgi:hypothetical protein
MGGLKMVSEQLEAVSRYRDWSNHAQHMEDVDAELAEINETVKIIVQAREFVGRIDDHLSQKIAAGESSPTAQSYAMFEHAMNLFSAVCKDVLPKAEDFARHGFPVEGISRLREIAADPSAGLVTAEIIRAAKQITSPDGSPMEVEISDSQFEVASEKGKPFRHLGND